MSYPSSLLNFPLQLIGVPDVIADWLRDAGCPVNTVGQHRTSNSSRVFGKSILFDGQNNWSRAVAKTYRQSPVTFIDVAEMLEQIHQTIRTNPAETKRGQFLSLLKHTLENNGGFWARVGDFPYPYQSLHALEKAHTPTSIPIRIASLFQKKPTIVEGSETTPSNAQMVSSPLCWQADANTFRSWWRERSNLEIQLAESIDCYQIACRPTGRPNIPVLEIWRGQHMASVPLQTESLVVAKENLVFQQQRIQHPGGISAGWTKNPFSHRAENRLSA